jgi:hypothetical protein
MRAPTAAHTADRSSDGSAWHSAPPIVPRIPHDGIGDERARRREDLQAAREEIGLEQVAVARHRADAHVAVVLAHVAQLARQRSMSIT